MWWSHTCCCCYNYYFFSCGMGNIITTILVLLSFINSCTLIEKSLLLIFSQIYQWWDTWSPLREVLVGQWSLRLYLRNTHSSALHHNGNLTRNADEIHYAQDLMQISWRSRIFSCWGPEHGWRFGLSRLDPPSRSHLGAMTNMHMKPHKCHSMPTLVQTLIIYILCYCLIVCTRLSSSLTLLHEEYFNTSLHAM
jgi:hypothetical protein